MNRFLSIAFSFATLAGMSSFALAHEAGAPMDPACADKRAAFHQKKLERFDLDKDGRLSDTERAQMKVAFKERREARRAEMLARFDANKDGVLDESERAAAKAERMQRVLARLDVNKDGVLSVEEVKCTPLAGQFTTLDTDRSGTLSVTELQAAKMHHGFRHHGDQALRRILKRRAATV
jgi:Ca2+-binding EF-hand superfamily protein